MEKFGIPMSLDGKSPIMPPELVGKTIHQIKAMGGTELGSMSMSTNMRTGGIDAKLDLTPEGESQARESKKELELEEEEEEKEFYIDNLSTEAKRFEDSSNFKRMER